MISTYGEVSWSDDGFDKSKFKNNKDSWLRLEPGPNIVRVITRPFQYIVHKGVKKDSDKGFGTKVLCSKPFKTEDGSESSCPLCEAGHQSSVRWFIGVIDRKSNAYKVLDISYLVHQQIKINANDPVWGPPDTYDINIIVNPNAGGPGYYTVTPRPHSPLSANDNKIKDSDVDLDYLKFKSSPIAPDKVQERMDKILEGAKLYLPPAKEKKKPTVAQSAPAKSNFSSSPKSVDEDEEMDDIFPPVDSE